MVIKHKSIKRRLLVFSVLTLPIILIVTISGCGKATPVTEPTYTFELGSIDAEGTVQYEACELFIGCVDKKSHGKIKINFFPAGQLGDYAAMHEAVSMGTLDMTAGPCNPFADIRAAIAYTGYVVSTWDEARQAYGGFGEEGWLTVKFSGIMEDTDEKVLALRPLGFTHICGKKPFRTPEEASTIKLRVPTAANYEAGAKGMGFIVTPIPYGELYTSLQLGVIDNTDGLDLELMNKQYYDVIDYAILTYDHFEIQPFTINLPLWNSLDKETQEILLNCATEMADYSWREAEKREGQMEKELETKGIEVIHLTPAELQVFVSRSRAGEFPVVEKLIGKELMDFVRAHVSNGS
ncbi:MAG: hypothetical protein D4R82_00980 [Dehalococcoidia bacterium]|nr:MAG: hypothetical protein D4R82_00980 [Dehalococcoidia bacterium]